MCTGKPYVRVTMTSGYTFGGAAKLKPLAEYKFRSFFLNAETVDQVIDLSASVADEVGRRRTVPEPPPQAPSLASCCMSAESAIKNLASIVVAVDVADTRNARPDPPSPDI